MSVHVSLHPVSAAPAELTKVAEPINPATSFSHALNAAADSVQQTTMQNAAGRDTEKKPQKKAESSNESSSTQIATSAQHAVDPLVATPVVPTVPVPDPTADQPAEETTTGEGTRGGLVQQIGMRPIRVANPIIATTQEDTGVATPSTTDEDGSATSVSNPDGPTSGAILEESDEVSAAVPGPDPALSLLSHATQATASADLNVVEGDSLQKDQSSVAPNDVAQIAATVSQQPAPAFQGQPVAANAPSGLDVSSTMTSVKAPAMVSEAKEGSSKPIAGASKDHATSDVHGKRKADNTDADEQGDGTTVALPSRFAVTTASSSHQQNDGQTGTKEIPPAQTAQGTFMTPTTDSHVAPQAVTSTQASDGPSQPVQANAIPAAETLATPSLSGARLIQSIHQSEMKLGMNSAEFGNISISTSVTHQSLSAQISLDHLELGRALAAHLPAMEEKLGNAYGLQARVEVRDGSNASYSGSSSHSGEGHRERQGGSGKAMMFSSGLGPVAARSTSTPVAESARLDIRI